MEEKKKVIIPKVIRPKEKSNYYLTDIKEAIKVFEKTIKSDKQTVQQNKVLNTNH